MSGGYVKATAEERMAYEYVKGEKFPDPVTPQAIAVARTCLTLYRTDEKEWKRQQRLVKKISGVLPGVKKNDTPLEKDEQIAAAQWLDLKGLCWLHVPNEGKRSQRMGASLKSQGLKPGFPDILILTPPPAKPWCRFVAIELKRQKGGTVSENQREWLTELPKHDGIAQVCNGAAEVVWFCESLGY